LAQLQEPAHRVTLEAFAPRRIVAKLDFAAGARRVGAVEAARQKRAPQGVEVALGLVVAGADGLPPVARGNAVYLGVDRREADERG